MNVREAIEHRHENPRVRLPSWIRIPEGAEPRLCDIYWESWGGGSERGEGYVEWTLVEPVCESGFYENVRHGQWIDLKDLELVEEGEAAR